MYENKDKKNCIYLSQTDKTSINAALIKSLSLIKKFKKVLPQKSTKKKFLGRKRLLSITKQMDIFISNSYMNINTQNCIICLQNINLNDRVFLRCGHSFHSRCIDEWINMSKNECPICRQNIEFNSRTSQNSINLEENENNNQNNNSTRNSHYSNDHSKLYFITKVFLMIFLSYMSDYLVISSIQQAKDIFPGVYRYLVISYFLFSIINIFL